MSNNDTHFELKNVTKTYGSGRDTVHALTGVSLTVNRGDQISIQGPTGGGKSTLLQLLGALDVPTSGSVTFKGMDLSRASQAELTRVRAENIGFIFQNYNLVPTMTAQENVQTALVPLRKEKRRAEDALRILTQVGLDDRLDHLPAELSGGQQQRVAIARALANEPLVLLADEPTGNLDEDTRDEVMDLLKSTASEHGITLLTVTHDSFVAARFERHIHIHKGRLSEKS